MDTAEILSAVRARTRTLDEIAEIAGVGRRQVSRWYNEDVEPLAPAVGRMLAFLGKRPAEIGRIVAARSLAGLGYKPRESGSTSPVRVEPRAATGRRG